MLIVVGTTGATNLPFQMISEAQYRGIPFIEINPDESIFRRNHEKGNSLFLESKSAEALTILVDQIIQNLR